MLTNSMVLDDFVSAFNQVRRNPSIHSATAATEETNALILLQILALRLCFPLRKPGVQMDQTEPTFAPVARNVNPLMNFSTLPSNAFGRVGSSEASPVIYVVPTACYFQ